MRRTIPFTEPAVQFSRNQLFTNFCFNNYKAIRFLADLRFRQRIPRYIYQKALPINTFLLTPSIKPFEK